MKNNLLASLFLFALLGIAPALHADVSYTAAYDPKPYYYVPSLNGATYIALQGGLNAAQRTFDEDIYGVNLKTESNIGGFAGIKLGTALGSERDLINPAVELDVFYNQCSENAVFNDSVYEAPGKFKMSSGAFLLNGILNFQLGAVKPYVGAGAGIYTEKLNATASIPELGSASISSNSSGFAWQILAGIDYPVSESVSIFTEYKFLNYVDHKVHDYLSKVSLSQHLVGAGIRLRF